MPRTKTIMEVVIPVPRKRLRVDPSEPPITPTAEFRVNCEQESEGCKNGFLFALPLEVFTEVIRWSYPGDLLALSRTNKALRQHLMRRLSRFMWQRAESNLHHAMGLPMCPQHMTEPAYAVLLFAQNCTVCGKPTTSRPDLYLYVRLCGRCHKAKIVHFDGFSDEVVDLTPCSPTIGPQNHGDTWHYQPNDLKLSVYLNIDEAHHTQRERARFVRSGDIAGLEEWESSRAETLEALLHHGVKLYGFLEKWEYDAKTELVKKERRQAIQEAGVNPNFLDANNPHLIHYSMQVMWKTYVEQPKPLTERAWKILLPTLDRMHDGSSHGHWEDRVSGEAQACWDQWCAQLLDMPLNPGGFASIAAALGVGTAATSSPVTATQQFFELVLVPYPNLSDALNWGPGIPFDCHWYSGLMLDPTYTEHDFLEYTANNTINSLAWRREVSEDLETMVAESWPELDKEDVILTVKGSSQPTAELDPTERRLLRADCVFKASHEHPLCSQLCIGTSRTVPLPLFFPDMLVTRRRDAWNSGYFMPFTDAKLVAQALLKEMGMSDAAHAELKVMGGRFACGCCEDGTPKDWSGILGHFIEEQHKEKSEGTKRTDRHTTDQAKVKVVPAEEAGKLPDLQMFIPPNRTPYTKRRFRGRCRADLMVW